MSHDIFNIRDKEAFAGKLFTFYRPLIKRNLYFYFRKVMRILKLSICFEVFVSRYIKKTFECIKLVF